MITKEKNTSEFYVYVLRSDKDGKRYIGLTNNLDGRLKEHNGGKVFSTSSRKPFRLIYYETFGSRPEARHREKHFKTAAGRRWLDKLEE